MSDHKAFSASVEATPGKCTQFELDVKRFHAPFIVKGECSHCGEINQEDLREGHLSYPKLGEPEKVYFCCTNCDYEFQVEVILTLNIEVAP